MGEFVVDTRSFCFICLNRTLGQNQTVKINPESNSISTELHSLQLLSRYLRLNLGRVLHEEGSKARLKADLCESCARLNQSFSRLYQSLEKIELEMAACIKTIHSEFSKANETGNAQEFFNLIDDEFRPGGDVKGKLEIAKIIRTEAVEKCSKIIKSGPPVAVLKLQRISMEEVKARQIARIWSKTVKSLSEELPQPRPQDHIHLGTVKAEKFIDMDDDTDDTDLPPNEDDNSKSHETFQTDSDFTTATHMPCDQDAASPEILTITKLEPVVVKPTRFICPASNRVVKKSNTRGLIGRTNKCKYCEMEFGSYSGMAYHIDAVHLKKRLICGDCGKEFSQRPNFNRHRQSAHLGVTYSCVGCNQTYKYKRGLTKHQQKTGCGVDFT